MGYDLKLLGRFELRAPSGKAIEIAGKKTQCLIGLMALAGGEPVGRGRLCVVLWGDRDEEQARNSLRQAFTALRKAFAGHGTFPFTVNDGAAAIARDAVDVDIWRFADAGSDDETAVALCCGPFLDGLSIAGEAAEDWLRAERQRFQNLLVERLVRLSERDIAAGNWTQAIAHAEKIVIADPLNEAGHRALMRGLAASGERTKALRQYQACCEALKAELGIEPEAATRQLYEEISQDAGGSAAPPVPASRPARLSERTGVAVLPFANLSGAPEQEFFADGLSEDLIAELARYRHLSVTGHRTTSKFKDRVASLTEVGRELGVDFIVEGSVRQAAGRVRVAVQLIDAETGAHVWADKFDREMADIFTVQDEIVGAVVARLSYNLDRAAGEQRQRNPTTSSSAYTCFLRARAAGRNGEEGLALDCLRQAIEIDPKFGRALAYLAFFYAFSRFSMAAGLDDAETARLARDHIERGLAADRSDPFILDRAALTYLMLGEPLAARRYGEAAARSGARDAGILIVNGLILACCGQHAEGVAMMEEAIRLEPESAPASYSALSDACFLLGDYEASLAALDMILDPSYFFKFARTPNLTLLGRYDEARSIVARAPASFDMARYARNVAGMCALPEDAERWLEGFRLGGVKV